MWLHNNGPDNGQGAGHNIVFPGIEISHCSGLGWAGLAGLGWAGWAGAVQRTDGEVSPRRAAGC